MKLKHLTLVVVLGSTFISCSKVKELEDKTDNMESTMEKMNKTMNNMDSNMTNMYRQVRQKESEDTRTKQMDILRDSNLSMGAKLTAAKKYFLAFEYQMWTNTGFDTKEFREKLVEDAMEELYRELTDIYAGYTGISPLDIDNANADTEAFYALATTAHFKNIYQESLLEDHPELEELDLYDMMKKSLKLYKRNKPLKGAMAVPVRGQNLEMTREILGARMNFMTALALKDMVNRNEMNLRDKARGALFKVFGNGIGSLNLNSKFEVQNRYTQKDIVKKLNSALTAKKVLNSTGGKARLDSSLSSIITNLRVVKKSNASAKQKQETSEVYKVLDQINN